MKRNEIKSNELNLLLYAYTESEGAQRCLLFVRGNIPSLFHHDIRMFADIRFFRSLILISSRLIQ